ncbi:unnamed protein product, partial [Onchocerca ochengi]|uniref:Uncharacterized protein n=1 Tax=Onchocerca ochengi TaxID=42157 RepID=A0A182F0L9_ONCOC
MSKPLTASKAPPRRQES